MTTTAIEPRQNGTQVARPAITPDAPMTPAELALMQGDLKALSSAERLDYYRRTCQSLGLNPLTRPFEYITLNNRLVLYARKDATDQLRSLRGVTIVSVEQQTLGGDLYVVTVKARMPDGREDMEIGAVSIAGLKGEALANAYMKALTKAKRRVTLSLCGLGWLDETEVETIPGARAEVVDLDTGEIVERPGPAAATHPQRQEQPRPKPAYDWDSEEGQALMEIRRAARNEGLDDGELSGLCLEWMGKGPLKLNLTELQTLHARLMQHVQDLADANRVAAAASSDQPLTAEEVLGPDAEPVQQGLGV